MYNERSDTNWIALPHHAISKNEQLAIYRNHYRIPLLQHLQYTYPAMAEYLGDQASNCLFHHYIDHYLSTHSNRRFYGEALLSFLNKKWDLLASLEGLKYSAQFILDLCLFEHTMARVSKIESTSGEDMTEDVTNQVISCTYDVITAYENWLDTEELSEPLIMHCTIQIYRHDNDVYYHRRSWVR